MTLECDVLGILLSCFNFMFDRNGLTVFHFEILAVAIVIHFRPFCFNRPSILFRLASAAFVFVLTLRSHKSYLLSGPTLF